LLEISYFEPNHTPSHVQKKCVVGRNQSEMTGSVYGSICHMMHQAKLLSIAKHLKSITDVFGAKPATLHLTVLEAIQLSWRE